MTSFNQTVGNESVLQDVPRELQEDIPNITWVSLRLEDEDRYSIGIWIRGASDHTQYVVFEKRALRLTVQGVLWSLAKETRPDGAVNMSHAIIRMWRLVW